MKCQKTEKYLIEYLEGSLSHDLRKEITAHLQECPECVRLVTRSRQLWTGLDRVETWETPANFYVRVRQKLGRQNRASAPWVHRVLRLEKIFIPTFATGIVLIGLFIGNFLGSSIYPKATTTDSTETTYVEYLGLDYWDSNAETDLLSDFTQGLQALETGSVNEE